MQRSRSLPGVLYAEDFDAPSATDVVHAACVEPAPPVAEPVVLEPTFSLVELQSASRRAHEEGRSQEREEVFLGLEARRADALNAIGDALRQARADCSRIAAAEATGLSRAVVAAVGAILPKLAAEHGLAEVADLLSAILPAMEGEPMLQIRVNPVLLEPLRNDFATLAMAGSVSIEWIAVEAMEPGDIGIKWQDGSMRRDTRALCDTVVSMLTGALDQFNTSSAKAS